MAEKQFRKTMNSNVDEEVDSKSNSENSINGNSIEDHQPKRKHYHRHTLEQIQEMEAFFRECPHPDDRQRKELSRQLGMEPLQVKFWFQNKRTQMKTQHEHEANTKLRAENEKLRAENVRFREALNNPSCFNCGETYIHQNQLKLENSRLRQEIGNISSITTKYVGKPTINSMKASSSSSTPHLADFRSSSNSVGCRSTVLDHAVSAMEELMMIAQMGEPLWISNMNRESCVLNEEEYFRAFSRVFGQKMDGFKLEASRQTTIVPMSVANVVEILMDVEQWANVFSGVVSRATNLQIVSSGLGGTYNEALQVMNAEFQVPSPLVPTRESNFLRYCRRHVDGTWVVVDVSLDQLHSTSLVTCRRRPSGCLIQDMPSGLTKVIWVEHVEVEDRGGHSIYKPLITVGLAFGARRWLAILDGYCQRLTTSFSTRLHSDGANNFLVGNEDGRKSMLNLGARMVTRFCRGVNASVANTWTSLCGNVGPNVKFMTRNNVDDPTMPFGFHLCIATSLWLPIPPKRVFDFLCDHNIRKEWDMLLNGGDVEEMAHVVSGKEEGNRVTLYQVKGTDSGSGQMIMLQETRTDPTASYVVYAPIDMVCANAVLGGEDTSYVPLLPSGFAILPDGPTGGAPGRGMSGRADTGGSLLTVALQVLVDSTPSANLNLESVVAASKLMCWTVDKIKHALVPQLKLVL